MLRRFQIPIKHSREKSVPRVIETPELCSELNAVGFWFRAIFGGHAEGVIKENTGDSPPQSASEISRWPDRKERMGLKNVYRKISAGSR